MPMLRVFALLYGLFLVLSSAAAAGAELLAHWPLDETAGTTAKDVTGLGHDGKIVGARSVPGAVGQALAFDGQGRFVSLGDFPPQEALTLAFWLKLEGPPVDGWQGLLSTVGPWEEGVLHVALRKGQMDIYLHAGQRRRAHVSSRSLSPGRWHHVAFTADVRQHAMRLTIDGVEESTADIPPQVQKIQLRQQVLGCESDGKRPERFFRGSIDDARI